LCTLLLKHGKSGETSEQSFKRSLSSRHTIGTAKRIDLWVPFNQPAKALEHELQQIFGAQTLS
jgi:hypothetical protein